MMVSISVRGHIGGSLAIKINTLWLMTLNVHIYYNIPVYALESKIQWPFFAVEFNNRFLHVFFYGEFGELGE